MKIFLRRLWICFEWRVLYRFPAYQARMRRKIAQAMVGPLRETMDYAEIGRQAFLTTPLEEQNDE